MRGGLSTRFRTSGVFSNPFRKRFTVSSLPTVYPAMLARSSKLDMYWLTSGNLNLRLSSCWQACWTWVWSVNCSLNSCMKWSHAASTLSLTGSCPVSHVVMSPTHQLCHRLGMRGNCPHLGSSIVLPYRPRLAPIPIPLALVQRVIVTCLFCPGTGLGRSRCLVSGRRQEALGLRHSSGQRRHCTLMDCFLRSLRHGFVMDYVSGIRDSF